MNATSSLHADEALIERFVDALFVHADDGGFVSLRSLYDDKTRVFSIDAHQLTADRAALVQAAVSRATQAARQGRPVVFAPPIATFVSADGAREVDLQNGLALSVECDTHPHESRTKLEVILGPATIVVASGGEWTNPDTGEVEDKVHLHWRLTEPTRDRADHERLKQARSLAADLLGSDPSSKPSVHPMRWPGSWHRKGLPRLARIVAESTNEIDLKEAIERLDEAWKAAPRTAGQADARATDGTGSGESRETTELITAILTGADYHAPIAALAMRFLKGGMPDAQAVLVLRGHMEAAPAHLRDLKDGVIQLGRWQSRYDDIPRAVSTARMKMPAADAAPASGIDVTKFRLDEMTAGAPPPQQFLLAPLMPLGTVGLLFGPGGVGKSLIALDLCLAVATRGRAAGNLAGIIGPLGGTVPPEVAGASVFLTLEDDRAEVHRRTASLDPGGRRLDAPCYVIPAIDLPAFDPALVTADGRAAALTQFAKTGIDDLLHNVARASGLPVRLLVLDPAGDFINADENDATFVKLLMRRLREAAARHRCTIILLGHVAKAMDTDAPSMRGSSAWVSNSRFAYALWRPLPDEAAKLAVQLNHAAESLVWGNLVKANHAGAPIGEKRIYSRDASGRLNDMTARLLKKAVAKDEQLALLADFCAECAAAGLPYTHTGQGGLWSGIADLPEPFCRLSKHKLEELGRAALDQKLLVKARTSHSQASPKFLDRPDGMLATGAEVEMFQGSREEALIRHRLRMGML